MALHTLYMHRSHTLYLPAAILSTWQDKLQVFSPFRDQEPVLFFNAQ